MLGSENIFYKYLSASSSLKTLESKTLKWSNARMFNDPFDMPANFSFAFEGNTFAKALHEEQVRLVFGPDEPRGDSSNAFLAACIVARRRRGRGASEGEFREFFARTIEETAAAVPVALHKLETNLKAMRDSYALLCVSKTHDNLLMWAHYAKDHSGCVLGLRCRPEFDRPLCALKPVKYSSVFPVIASLPEYIKHVTGQIELDFGEVFERFVLTKSDHWCYEQEWRGLSQLNDRTAGFDFEPLITQELGAVYLGVKLDSAHREQLLAIVRRDFPDTDVFQAVPSKHTYALEFERI
jgi:hypothetical protein